MNYTALFKAAIVFLIVLCSMVGLGYLYMRYTAVTGIVIVGMQLMFLFWLIYEYVKEDD